jgi:hypothetical protein
VQSFLATKQQANYNMYIRLLIALLLLPIAALADGGDQSNKYFMMVGGFWPDVNTTARIDGNEGRIGTKLDFESDLGLQDREALFTIGAGMRIGERHYLDLLYFDLSREATHALERTISVGDETFTAHATVKNRFDTEVFRFSYGYAFISTEKQLLLGQVGAHYTRISAGVRLANDRQVSADADSNIPLPVLGIVYNYRITPSLSVNLRGQIFRLDIEGIDGSLDNLSASLSYGFTPQFSVFGGYNYYSMDVDARTDHWNGSFDFGYHGPWLGLNYGFGRL